MAFSPVKPPFVVGGQDGVRAPLLESADEGLQLGHCQCNKLCTAEWLQVADILFVVLKDQIVDAHGWVAVCHVEATACETHDEKTQKQNAFIKLHVHSNSQYCCAQS